MCDRRSGSERGGQEQQQQAQSGRSVRVAVLGMWAATKATAATATTTTTAKARSDEKEEEVGFITGGQTTFVGMCQAWFKGPRLRARYGDHTP